MTSSVNISFGAFQRQDLLEYTDIFSAELELDKLLRIAPPMTVNARHSRLPKEGTSVLLDETGPSNPVDAVTWNAPARTTEIEFDTYDVDLLRFAHDGLIISDHDMQEASANGVDPDAKWFKDAMEHAAAIHGRRLGITLNTAGNYHASNTSTSLDLSDQTADLQGAIQAVQRRFRNSGVGSTGLIAVCSDVVLDLMTALDQVRAEVAITGYTDSGSAVRRTGVVTGEEVINWFRSKFGIELIVLEKRTIRSGGAAPVLEPDLYFLHAGTDALSRKFVATALRSDYAGEIAMPFEYVVNNPQGRGLYMDSVHGFALPSNILGFSYIGVDA
jgi:hypothetical protein